MIYTKENILEKIKGWNNDNTYIISDFDRTLTKSGSKSSWSMIADSGEMSEEYLKERDKLFKKYHPYESDPDLSHEEKDKLMTEWWEKHIGLLIKYKLTEEILKNVENSDENLAYRDGAKEMLQNLNKKNIPVIIMSAGIRNIIIDFLDYTETNYENLIVISNNLVFENGVTIGFSNEPIHSYNKNEISLFDSTKEHIGERKHKVLFGDVVGDVLMVKEEDREAALKVGFLKSDDLLESYMEVFDIVATNDTSFDEILELIGIF